MAAIEVGSVADCVAAAGAIGTFGVAVIAVVAAFRQVREARALREEQARPIVVVDFALDPTTSFFFDIVVKNIGATLASTVKITFDPPIASTLDDSEQPIGEWSWFHDGFPTIPPGKEYRAMFDTAPERFTRTDLPRRYDVTVEFDGPSGREPALKQTLDLDVYYNGSISECYSAHHIAMALRAIAKAQGAKPGF